MRWLKGLCAEELGAIGYTFVRVWRDQDLHVLPSPCCDLLLDLTPRHSELILIILLK